MLRTETLVVGPLATNCYLIWDEGTREAVIVDPGAEGKRISERVASLGLSVRAVVLTHAHVDHAGSAGYVTERCGAPLLVHRSELELLRMLSVQAQMFGLPEPDPTPDASFVEDGRTLAIGDARLTVRHTPGHSPGSICLVDDVGRRAWVGDLIFQGAVGRTDLPGGSYEALVRSIRRVIFALPDDYCLYPGHGDETTVEDERRWNPVVGGVA